ncbi:MAG: hypothetical protein ABL984_11360 [Pyrinomonadaceae bacterium]
MVFQVRLEELEKDHYPEMASSHNLPDTISTLLVNGFQIDSIQRHPVSSSILNVYKYDRLGAQVRYTILFACEMASQALVKTVQSVAKGYGSMPLIVSDKNISAEGRSYSYKAFFDLFGGTINTGLVLIPNLVEVMKMLGTNKLPAGLSGEPDDLHEIYVRECLSFALDSPTRRYGIDRSFQPVPDGVVLGKKRLILLYDSKAYSIKKEIKGFKFSADDVKRFASYVNDYNARYADILGTAFSFVVVTGEFHDSKESLQNRSDGLYKESNCRLSCVKSEELAKIVELIRARPSVKSSIRWENIFNKLIVKSNLVAAEISRIEKDKLLM